MLLIGQILSAMTLESSFSIQQPARWGGLLVSSKMIAHCLGGN